MNRKQFVFIIILFLILTVGCERPTEVEVIWGEVISVNGRYYKDANSVDCRIVVQFEEIRLTTVYLVEHSDNSLIYESDYKKCRKALLLKEGDKVSAIKRTWADKSITYELDP